MLNQHRKPNLTEKCQTCIWTPHLMSTPKNGVHTPERLLRRSRLKKTRQQQQRQQRRRRRHTGHDISSVDLKILAELKSNKNVS